ncbi:hypothetical protein CYLTODRAFT_486724 [Cylindrobasidium torrendii FP15055 ss-10]|uniref:Uncharacterized protein n=1 Tax=Cylindrobasidium torrendii FP15055 ss-10 TaxID=1314674 RepID=A0A0D7BN01_9AGAR|nr:hypothetical protein CYLTODRAFT_486724 [Cylindrobasidium torrendii FP15055 ss-10]
MVAHGGVSARISSGGTDLLEYASGYDAVTNTVSCWVPCEAGAPYKMFLTRDTRDYATAAYFYADTHFLGCKLLESTDKTNEFSCAGARVSSTCVQALHFPQDSLESLDPLAELGQLRVEYWRVDVIRGMNQSHLGLVLNSTASRSLSAGLSSTPTIQSKVSQLHEIKKVTLELSFVFAYRALDFLVRNGIAPLVPTLSTSPAAQKHDAPLSQKVEQPIPLSPSRDQLTAFAVPAKYAPYYTQTTLRSDSSQASSRTIDNDAADESEAGEEAMDSDEEEMRQIKADFAKLQDRLTALEKKRKAKTPESGSAQKRSRRDSVDVVHKSRPELNSPTPLRRKASSLAVKEKRELNAQRANNMPTSSPRI